MAIIKNHGGTIFYILISMHCCAQNINPVVAKQDIVVGQSINKNYYKHPKNLFWGNSTVFASGYTHSTTNDLAFEIGRAYVAESELVITYRNIGVGYDHLFNNTTDNYYKLFYELSGAMPPLGGISMRLEGMVNNIFNTYFLRPYIGLTYTPVPKLHFDVQYCHTFLLAGKNDPFRNGITLRAKMYLNERNWVNLPAHKHHP